MSHQNRIEDWVKEVEQDKKLINAFTSTMRGLKDFGDMMTFLSSVTREYRFRRENVASFFVKTRDPETQKRKLVREKNGFYLSREVLENYFSELKFAGTLFTLVGKCMECKTSHEFEISLTDSVIEINYEPKPSVLKFDLIITNAEINGEKGVLWVHLDKNRKLRQSERDELFLNKSSLLEIYLGDAIKNRYNFISIVPCHLKKERETKNEGSMEETSMMEKSSVIIEHDDLKMDDDQFDLKNTFQKLDALLSRTFPYGTFAGKPMRWIIGFKPYYLEKVLKEQDPESELYDYLNEIVKLAEIVDFDGYPDLFDLRALLKRVKKY